jgi:hypothetical protein
MEREQSDGRDQEDPERTEARPNHGPGRRSALERPPRQTLRAEREEKRDAERQEHRRDRRAEPSRGVPEPCERGEPCEGAKRLQDAVRVVKTKYETAKMHYLESGKGEPMILIHSAGQSLYTFRGLFYKLAMSYRVIALDLVGHGYSDRPDFFDYGIGDHAESIAGFMDAMGIESAHILGFSMGAGFALEFAKRHPDRVGRVIAISPGGITGSMPLSVRMIESGLFGGLASRLYRMRTVEKLLNEGKKLPEIFMSCGTEDFLLNENRAFHQFLTDKGVAHEYTESPGNHDFTFWNEYTAKFIEKMFA